MTPLDAARDALKAGDRDRAIALLATQVAEDTAAPVESWRLLAVQRFQAGHLAEADSDAARGLTAYPGDYTLLNTHGVILRRLGRFAEAASALEQATRIDPGPPAAHENLFNALMDGGEPARAEAVAAGLTRMAPQEAGHWQRLATALRQQDKSEAALAALGMALELDPGRIAGWVQRSQILLGLQRIDEALAALEAGLDRIPAERTLLKAKSTLLRRAQRFDAAAAFLDACETQRPGAAWVRHQRGLLLSYSDRRASNALLEEALALEPGNFEVGIALAEGYARELGGGEGTNLQRAYALALDLLPRNTDPANKVLSEIFGRVCDFDALDALGDFETMGRGWARANRHSALLEQLGRVKDDADRLELLEQHRIWGRNTEAWAARRPIARPEPRPRDGKLRLGFMSSDLRDHVVAKFAAPLFDHLDRERFEVFAYSFFQGQEDDTQRRIAGQVSAFRWWPRIEAREAAERIAADRLDMLIELGGSTNMNRIEVMAFRPAPLQASWLGYPHSSGLSAIDFLICDAVNAPTRPELMLERPLRMPSTWIPLGERDFADGLATGALPQDRNGRITYGSASNPYKYNRRLLQTWARIVQATPGSQFAFIRPECGAAGFRANVERAFAAEGVAADRLIWRAVRGAHLAHYNDIDISLDTFPLTGGTTTAECLWMGVPLVSLVGPAFYERLSASIMTNSGIGDLAVSTVDGYVAAALNLAGDRERRLDLRGALRERMRDGPLGQTRQFARDFYDMIYRTVRPGG